MELCYNVAVFDEDDNQHTIFLGIGAKELKHWLAANCEELNNINGFGKSYWLKDNELREYGIPYNPMGWKVEIMNG